MTMIRICVVEDEIIIREGIKTILQQTFSDCMDILEAENGERCLDILMETDVQIIITDICMPDLDGLRLMELVYERNTSVQFIILSGYDNFDYCKHAMQFGALDYLLKPVDEAELLCAVRKAIARIDNRKEADSAEIDVKHSRLVMKILEYIKRYYNTSLSLNVLADKFHYNSRYISQIIKKETGVNFVDYLNQVRIQRAKQFLKQDGNRVEEISTKVGYNDSRYFAKIFKNSEGVTPSEYRKKIG